jgi:hypothetical protein
LEENTCNTRKSRDKRERRHTVGLFLGAYPCGIVGLWDELYGSESISQVYSICLEYLSNVTHNIKIILYDDACHLVRYAKNQKDLNEQTKAMSNIQMYVDKFHFKNHIDPWCIENCDPNEIKDLEDVNTPICEQLFKKVNRHKNCKSMNEARYFMFWMFNIDMHNLDIEGLDNTIPDPRSEHRWNNLKIRPVDYKHLPQKQEVDSISEEVDELTDKIDNLHVVENNDFFICKLCGAGYSSDGYLLKHMTEKHGIIYSTGNKAECPECGNILSSKQAILRHIQDIHRKCKHCKQLFISQLERDSHQIQHTTCEKCGTIFPTMSKLKRHEQQVHK